MGRPGGRVKATRFEPVRLGLGDRIGQAASIAADGAQEPSAQASKHGPAAKRPVPSFRADMRSERVPGVAALAPPDGRDSSSCWKHASGMTRSRALGAVAPVFLRASPRGSRPARRSVLGEVVRSRACSVSAMSREVHGSRPSSASALARTRGAGMTAALGIAVAATNVMPAEAGTQDAWTGVIATRRRPDD